MLETALNNPTLTDAEKRMVQQQAQSNGIAAALGALAGLVQAAQERKQAASRAMDAKIEREEEQERAAWQAWLNRSTARQTPELGQEEQQRQQAAAAYQAYRQGELEG